MNKVWNTINTLNFLIAADSEVKMTDFSSVKFPDCGVKNSQQLGLLENRSTFADIKIEPFESYLYQCLSCHMGFRYPRLSRLKIIVELPDATHIQSIFEKISLQNVVPTELKKVRLGHVVI